MRPSRKPVIVAAAKRHLAAYGKEGLKLDLVAIDVGMSSQGLRYHFRTAEELAAAVVEEVAADWVATLERVAGCSLRYATPAERTRAYVAVLLTADLDVHDLLVLIQMRMSPELGDHWLRRVQPWTEIPSDLEDTARLRLLHAQVLAEGLFARFMTGTPRSAESYAALSRLALTLARG